MDQNPTSVDRSNGNTTQDGAGAAKGSPVGPASALKVEAARMGDEVKQVAGKFADTAKKTAETRLEGGKDRAAQTLGTVADALRHTKEHLGTTENAMLGNIVSGAADRVEGLSGYIQKRTIGELVSDLEGFARREPALFLGGSFVMGLLGGRFLKSARPSNPQAGSPRQEGASGSNYRPVKPSPWQQQGPRAQGNRPGMQMGASSAAPLRAGQPMSAAGRAANTKHEWPTGDDTPLSGIGGPTEIKRPGATPDKSQKPGGAG